MFESLTHSREGETTKPSRTTKSDVTELSAQPPIRFPTCSPAYTEGMTSAQAPGELVTTLRSIQRPVDVRIRHLEAIGLHLISDASLEDIIPDASYLPLRSWEDSVTNDVEENEQTQRRYLSNEQLAPDVKAYRDRVRELRIPNSAAFRTVRRLPPPAGEHAVRPGNAYDFFKNLELMSGFTPDATQPQSGSEDRGSAEPQLPTMSSSQAYRRVGPLTAMPADYRVSVLNSITKLVAYGFGCNVSASRTEPRLCLTSVTSTTLHHPFPEHRTSSFPSNLNFIFRVPLDRNSARANIVEGPVAALSARPSIGFTSEIESVLDMARETVALLLTAQLRAREGKTERKIGQDQWWCSVPRWGGGMGGPIGREVDRFGDDGTKGVDQLVARTSTADVLRDMALARGGYRGATPAPNVPPTPAKKVRRTLPMYDAYRMIRPPSSTWDRKARYEPIGKRAGQGFDDVFLVSCLNHHVCVLRMRVPDGLLAQLEGEGGAREKVAVWRSKWWDLFVPDERVEAMRCIWGMMAFLMRKI